MKTFDNLRSINNNLRSINVGKWFDILGKDWHEPDFLDHGQSPFQNNFITTGTTSQTMGITDRGISPSDINDMVNRDAYFSPLFEQLTEALFKNDFYIEPVKPNTHTNRKAKMLMDDLKEIGYEELVEKLLYALWADGGGNALLFSTRVNSELKLRLEPFLDDGIGRVMVYGDDDLKKVTKYEVIGIDQRPIFTLDPNEDYVTHLRYKKAGNYRFSNNPAKKAVYWYILKKYIAGSNVATYKVGLQDPTIMSPDYDGLTALVNAMGDNKVSANSQAEYTKDPIAFFAKQSVLDDGILKKLAGNARKSNALLKMKMPYKFNNVERSNLKLQTLELLQLCDTQMGYTLRTSRGLLNTSQAKYNNAEMERDNWASFVLDPAKRDIEQITQDWILPFVDPTYDSDLYKARFGRDPNEEEIKVFKAKTERNTAIATTIVSLEGTLYKYDLKTNEIIETKVNTKPKQEIEEKQGEGDEIVDEVEGDRSFKKKVRAATLSEKVVEGPITKKFRITVQKAVFKQLTEFTKRLSKQKTLDENFAKTLKPISQFGLTVSVYKDQLLKPARIGVESFMKDTGIKDFKRAVVNGFDYPNSVLSLMDSRAQMMIKGINTLGPVQKKSIMKVFGKGFRAYKGLDEETSQQVSTIVKQSQLEGTGVKGAVKRLQAEIPGMSKNRATVISRTDTAQSLEGTRDLIYDEYGFDENKWTDVGDHRVRKTHRANSAQGWIKSGEDFEGTGTSGPSMEIECRCSKQYRKSKKKK